MTRAKIDTNTKFMDGLRETLLTKGLAVGTANLYIIKLRKINNDTPFTSLSFLKDTTKIAKRLNSETNLNTRKSYMTAVVSILSNTNAKGYAQATTFYKALLNNEKMNYDKIDQNEMTETQKKNWMSWSDVITKYNELGELVNKITADDDMTGTMAGDDLTDHLVMSFYVLTPPRRNADYYLMKLDTDGKMEDKNFNYFRPKTKEFIFNNYKTKKTYSTQVVPVSFKLMNVLTNFIKLMNVGDDEFLVLPENTRRNSANAITKILNRVLDKKIGASMLRHIYLTEKYGDIKNEMAKDAELMTHSVAQQKDYIKKD